MSTWDEVSRRNGIPLGRNDLPDALMLAVWDHRLTDPDEIAKALFDAWQGAEFPGRMYPRGDWLEVFHQVGFLEDGRRAAPPRTPPDILYRASPARYRNLMSWTDDLKQARWFNDRNNNYFHLREKSRIWMIHPQDGSILAHFGGGRGEGEWLLDIEKEDVTEYTQQDLPTPTDADIKSPDAGTAGAINKEITNHE